jgi:hypothetical protein
MYPAKLSFITEGEIKTSHDKEKQRELMTTKPVVQNVLKGILHRRGR